jgi:Flp pilus assembly protein TadG
MRLALVTRLFLSRPKTRGLRYQTMRSIRLRNRWGSSSGQSLLETALLLPLILLVVLNAINFGYYFIVALNLASAPRQGVEYAIQGFVTPATPGLAPAGPATSSNSVSYLTYQDLAGLSGTSTSSTITAVRVCSEVLGLTGTGSSQTANCASYGTSATFSSAAADPEAPTFVLHRVDVQYTVRPLIGATNFRIAGLDLSLLTPNLTFHRQVSMRALN